MRVLIVIPTFNEALNLPHLVPRILMCAPAADILVVDDGSPDGTANVAREMAATHNARIQVLERPVKAGRGGAVLAGLRAGMGAGTYEGFVEMDADLSHQPEELPQLLDAARAGADLVVGSRYLPGARIEGWSWRRKVWSRTSNQIIRSVLRVPLKDFTNGYRFYSTRAAAHLLSAPLRETGYITLSEWAYVLNAAGMTLVEIPTVFINRRYGASNMSSAEAMDALRGVVRIRRGLRAVPD